jgi:hypothetical protein
MLEWPQFLRGDRLKRKRAHRALLPQKPQSTVSPRTPAWLLEETYYESKDIDAPK